MKIWFSPYHLYPRTALNRQSQADVRLGFLLKVQERDFEAGYADVHPWRQFGDRDVEFQLKKLKQGLLTLLLKRSLFFATLDGLARDAKTSLFDKNLKIKNHFSFGSLKGLSLSGLEKQLQKIAAQKYKTIKIKVGEEPKKEIALLSALPEKVLSHFSWRLDFNGSGGEKFLAQSPDRLLEVIEFIEDPTAYNPTRWKTIEKKFKVALAYDQPKSTAKTSSYTGIRVIKPARQAELARSKDIITSSMDHPVGQSFAFWQAQESVKKTGKQTHDFGLKTEHLFKPNSFFREITSKDAFFKPSEGYGVGFDDLLRRQTWYSL